MYNICALRGVESICHPNYLQEREDSLEGLSDPVVTLAAELDHQGSMRGLPRTAPNPGSPPHDSINVLDEREKSGGFHGSLKVPSEAVIDLCSDSEASFNACAAPGHEDEICIIE